jgi:hypothetical protein
LKGLAVLLVFLIFRAEFDSILDGIVYAAIVALGFAATENAFYIYTAGYQQGGYSGLLWLVFVRVFLVGWQHPFYTAFFGIGLAVMRLSRSPAVKLAAPLAGWWVAVSLHAMHNTLGALLSGAEGLIAAAAYDWSGWLFMFLFIVWAIYREQAWIVNHLREEVSLGHISPLQYRTACSAWAQSFARLNGLFSGSFRATNRFYQLCAELAHKKQQRSTLGEEGGNSKTIESLRSDLRRLSAQVRS